MTRKSDRGNVKRSDPPEEDRRKYLKTVGALVAGLAVGGAAGWLSKPAERVEVPGVTVTERITETVTKTVTAPITPTTPTPTLPPKPSELKVLALAWETIKRWSEVAIPAFEEKTGIKVSLTTSDYVGTRKKIFLDLPEASFDIYCIDSIWLSAAAESGYLLDIGPLLERDAEEVILDDFPPKVQDHIMMWQGKYYTLPIEWILFLQIWRKDLLDKYGAKLPETWDEFLENVKAVHLKENETSGICVWGARGHGVVTTWASIWYAMGGHWFKSWPEKPWDFIPTVNTDTAVEALKLLVELGKHSTPGYLTFGWSDINEAISVGKAASLCTWTSGYPFWEDPKITKFAGKMQYAMMPMHPGLPRKIAMGGWGFGINKNSPNVDWAWELIKFATSPEILKEMALYGPEDTPYAVATRASVWADPEVQGHFADDFAKVVLDSMPYLESEFRPRVPEYTEIEETVGLRLNQALAGELTPEEAIEMSQTEVEEIMRKAGKL